MCDTARNIGPSGAALVCQLLANIFKGYHAVLRTRGDGYSHRERFRSIPQLHHTPRAFAGKCRQRGRDKREFLPNDCIKFGFQQLFRRRVGELDHIIAVNRNNPGGHRFQYRLNEQAPFVKLVIGGQQCACLFLQTFGHAIE